jgi:hypothetical protein
VVVALTVVDRSTLDDVAASICEITRTSGRTCSPPTADVEAGRGVSR